MKSVEKCLESANILRGPFLNLKWKIWRTLAFSIVHVAGPSGRGV
jgi:hypothetical protein